MLTIDRDTVDEVDHIFEEVMCLSVLLLLYFDNYIWTDMLEQNLREERDPDT